MTCTVVSDPIQVPPTLVDLATNPQESSKAIASHDENIAEVALPVIQKTSEKKEAAPVHKKITVKRSSPEQTEEAFVAWRKNLMELRFEQWKKAYDPAPGIGYSCFPNMANIVRIESMDVVDTFIKKVKVATTRQKLAALLRKNAKVIQDNMDCMNTATVEKMNLACKMIERELGKLGCVEEPPKKSGEKKPLVVAADDPLFSQKTGLLKKLKEWREDFVPQPSLVIFLAGAAQSLTKRVEGLFDILCKGVAKAKTKMDLATFLEKRKELTEHYRALVNTATETKLIHVCGILDDERKGLIGTSS
jgi:hypothetical protein